MKANGLVSFLLELNVLNVKEIERHLKQLGARARYPQVKKWLLTVARKYIINKADEATQAQEYEPLTKRPRRKDQYSTMPDEMPDWVSRDLAQDRAVHYFKDIQPRQRQLWKDIENIIDWFNAEASADDPALNRLDRVSFDEALRQAKTWRAAIDENPWKFVKDNPPVAMEMGKGWRWVKLETPNHTRREGQLMNHCVGGGSYQRSDLYSLRDPENVPHITMEVHPTTNSTKQVKGNSNKKPAPEYQKYIRPFMDEMGITLEGDSRHVD